MKSGEVWRDVARCGDIWRDVECRARMASAAPSIGLRRDHIGFRWISLDVARPGDICRDLAKFGEMWEFVPGWPVPHLVWDYAVGFR